MFAIKGALGAWCAQFHCWSHNFRQCVPDVCTFFLAYSIQIHWGVHWEPPSCTVLGALHPRGTQIKTLILNTVRGSCLRGSCPKRSSLRGSCLRDSCPKRSCLRGSCLKDNYLRGSCLRGSCLRGSCLRGSCPKGSCSRGSCLRGSCLRGSRLRGSCLRQCSQLRVHSAPCVHNYTVRCTIFSNVRTMCARFLSLFYTNRLRGVLGTSRSQF